MLHFDCATLSAKALSGSRGAATVETVWAEWPRKAVDDLASQEHFSENGCGTLWFKAILNP